ncbi:MAG: TonB-dependent receptor, partial [Vicinamibacterales bacterium]
MTQAVTLLQTDRADIGRKIETRELADLPLLMNRNFQGLLNLVPGTSRVFRPHSEFFNAQDSISTQVNGQSRMANNVQFEGIDNNHRTGLLTALIPPIEALQTVDITTSNFEAELGRAGGAVTNITLKSGSNDWHGSAYEFNRVSATAARNVFALTRPPTVFNLFGANLGGPILKNRTFFFVNYQGIRDRRGDVTRATIPTLEFRRGDLGASTTTIYDPNTGNSDGTGRVPFAGNIIPESRISPIARKILALVPPPTFSGLVSNYERATVRKKDTDSIDFKIDHQVHRNDTFSFRYSLQEPEIFDPSLFGIYGGPKRGGFAGFGTQRAQNGAINYTRIFSQTFLAELRIGVMRYRNDAKNEDTGRDTSRELGIPGANLGDPVTSGISTFDVDGFSNPVVGFDGALPWARAETNFDFVQNWTKIAGNHTLKWGADIRRNRDDLFTGGWPIGSRGRFTFRAGPTARNGDLRTSFGNSFASFLLDLPNAVGRGLAGQWSSLRQTTLFTYVQDKWQVSPKLTLDLGLRHELWFNPTPANPGGFSNYNPRTNSLEIAGIGSV